MRFADFGDIDGPMVLFGGTCSNLQATEALVHAAGGRPGLSTGDAVAYCADPNETVDLLRDAGFAAISGNCEQRLGEDADDCGCGFAEGSTCDRLSAAWWSYLQATLSPDNRAWLRSLPALGRFTQSGLAYGVLHGGVTAVNRFLWPSSPDTAFLEEIDALEAMMGPVDGIVAGHCGIAFQRVIGRHHWINPGSVGLPPHDGRTVTRYAVLSGGEVVIHRLPYDHGTAAARMAAVGLTQGYDRTVTNGLWPSEDILPEPLRR